MAHATTTDLAGTGRLTPLPAPSRRAPLFFPPLGRAGLISVPVLTVLGFYRPKFDQIPLLGGASFVMNFVWLGLATVAAAIWILHGRGGAVPKRALTLAGAFGLFFAYSLLSLAWSPDPGAYGFQKNLFAIAVCLASLVCMTAVCSQGRVGVERFFRFLLLYGLAVAVLMLTLGGPFSSRFGYSLSGDYQMTSRILALALGTLMAGFVLHVGGPLRIARAGIAGLLLLMGLMSAGGRTGLMAAVLVVAAMILVRLLDALRRGRAPVPLLAVMLLAVLGVAAYLGSLDTRALPATIGRVLWIMDPERLQEFNRLQRLVSFPDLFGGAPLFGHGSGSWVALEGKDIHYPHNIVIEVLVELGIVGAIAIVPAFWVALTSLAGWPRDSYDVHLNACCWAYFVVSLTHSMSMGDFSLNFGLYSSLALMAMRPHFLARSAG